MIPKRKKYGGACAVKVETQGGGAFYLDCARAAVEWRDEARSFCGSEECSALADLRAFFICQCLCSLQHYGRTIQPFAIESFIENPAYAIGRARFPVQTSVKYFAKMKLEAVPPDQSDRQSGFATELEFSVQ